MELQLKQHHIDYGVPQDPAYCPIALLLADTYEGQFIVAADGRVFPWRLEHEVLGKLDGAARAFIRTFDKQGKNAVKPISFQLEWLPGKEPQRRAKDRSDEELVDFIKRVQKTIELWCTC